MTSDSSKVISFQMNNLTGAYNGELTKLNLLVHVLSTSNHSISARVSYDWTGDGIWDRMYIFLS